ncbi:glutamine hydrolyzing CTP synthase [candidate division CSSED10-310 bacterium]|uniref:CTP synthase n=1 Tax=candidate division CSSED10-310 bacterium TaxID=2855610 RepID=A0ABV6Z2A9_UNCC1
MQKEPKYIVITGGVLSGLGKGIASASIGFLLSRNLKIVPIKCDGYLNTDPGTMNPIEHGEVFVLDDGGEVDMDFGHYERFINIRCKAEWNLTMGKIFQSILEKERTGDYLGKTVQYIPHVTDEIKSWIYNIAKREKADLTLVEIGGTVGDLESDLYLEAVRQMRTEVGRNNIMFIHLTYIPIPSGSKEQKSKPTQQSVKILNERGLEPDIIIGRCSRLLDDKIKSKIAMFCNVEKEAVISGIDVKSVYEIPFNFEKERLSEIIHKKLQLYSPPDLDLWNPLVANIKKNHTRPEQQVNIAICGKYTALEDSYASIIEALHHCEAHLDLQVKTSWVETTDMEKGSVILEKVLKNVQGVIVPGGFGIRGIEGKIQVIRFVRENMIPFLGICYGMQLAVVEYARHICGIKEAHLREAEADGITGIVPVIDFLPTQRKVTKKGATMRLGGYDILITAGTKAHEIFADKQIRRRFRHRYEVNPEYVPLLEEKGLIFSGKAAGEDIVQVMELPGHPYFLGGQFHPELTSSLSNPAPLFYHFVKAASEYSQS